MTSVTVFTFGDPERWVAASMGDALVRDARGLGAEVLGLSVSAAGDAGEWQGSGEFCGALVVSGLSEAAATLLARVVATDHEQDAIGVFHNDTGRTLAVPGSSELYTAGEVWS